MNINLKSLVFFITLTVVAALLSLKAIELYSVTQTSSTKPKNLILISIDTLRADSMGVYGYKKDTTPNIDAFAKRSTVFTNAYTQVPATYPSFAALMTGLSPFESGIYSNLSTKTDSHGTGLEANESNRPIPIETKTLAQILKDNNYTTAAFNANIVLRPETTGLARGFDTYFLETDYLKPREEAMTKQAMDWLDKKPSDRPFFLWVHYFAPHIPYIPTEENACKFNEKYCKQIKESAQEALEAKRQELNGCIGRELDNDTVGLFKTLYDAEVFEADKNVGTLLDKIYALGLDKSSVIVFYSDHGEGFENKFYFNHSNVLYDSSVKTPLLIHYPGQTEQKNLDGFIGNASFFWSILQTLNIDTSSVNNRDSYHASSINFSNPVIKYKNKDSDFKGEETIFFVNTIATKFAVRKGDYKYTYSANSDLCGQQPRELHNLKKDPAERFNIINNEREIAEDLHNELLMHLATHPLYSKEKSAVDELHNALPKDAANQERKDLIEELKSLGY